MSVKLVSITKPLVDGIETAEEFITYCARVSNPSNQLNTDTSERLIQYLIKNKHWSPFEMVNLTMEISTTRDIGRQILRHRSFSFQEFSQRYSDRIDYNEPKEARLQDSKNRQNSLEIEDENLDKWWKNAQLDIIGRSQFIYSQAIERGVAKEVARVVLPEGLTLSRMYMSGSLRSWIHYCDLRTTNGTQKEHRVIAEKCKEIIKKEFPSIWV